MNLKRHVWIVRQGETNYGSNICAVFQRKPSDRKVLASTMPPVHGLWAKMESTKKMLRWKNGVDYIECERFEVQT